MTLASVCQTCVQGSYAGGGSTGCTTCPSDSTTDASGSTAGTDCKCTGGKFGDPFKNCAGCRPNYYCTPTSEIACPTGYFSLAGSTQSTDCACQPSASFVAGSGCTCLDGYSKVDVAAAAGKLGNRECLVCPANSYCKSDATTGCPDNSLSPAGSVLVTDCRCNDGYYWDAATNACPQCPAGFYCKNNAKSQCPENTNSPAGSALQTHCACNAGFKCRRVRDVRVAIKFQLTAAEFEAQEAAIRAKIATAASVPESAVTFSSASTVAARRLLALGAGSSDPGSLLLEISAHIATATDLAPLIN
jgi:hypothetical protein